MIGLIPSFLRVNESAGSAVFTVAVLSGELEAEETVFVTFSTQTFFEGENSATGQKKPLHPPTSSHHCCPKLRELSSFSLASTSEYRVNLTATFRTQLGNLGRPELFSIQNL